MVDENDAGYWRGKCEVYERLFPSLIESVMGIAMQSKSPNPGDVFGQMLGQGLGKLLNTTPKEREQIVNEAVKKAAEDTFNQPTI